MGRTTTTGFFERFIADKGSISQTGGEQVNWANVGASFVNAETGLKEIPAGTIMAPDTATGTGVIPRVDSGADTANCIILTAANEGSTTAALTGYGVIVGGVIFQALLPDSAETDFAVWLGELETAGVGTFVWMLNAGDSSAS